VNTLIIGASGSSAEIALMLTTPNLNSAGHLVVGFLDDNTKLQGSQVFGLPVLGNTKSLENYAQYGFTSGIGSSKNFETRLKLLQNFKNFLTPIICISTLSVVSKAAIIEAGAIVSPNCFIGSNSAIRSFVYVMPNTFIGHSSEISAGSIICSGVTISGNVNIGESCYIGAGSVIKDHISISPGILVGSGSNVVSDLIDKGVYVGNPARKLE
jgi:sugar O-acyltransferase (sialic acid O-acetyltransferase NeuD family)